MCKFEIQTRRTGYKSLINNVVFQDNDDSAGCITRMLENSHFLNEHRWSLKKRTLSRGNGLRPVLYGVKTTIDDQGGKSVLVGSNGRAGEKVVARKDKKKAKRKVSAVYPVLIQCRYTHIHTHMELYMFLTPNESCGSNGEMLMRGRLGEEQ